MLYVGRLTLDKGLPLLFDAYRVLVKKFPKRLRLVVVGDGPEGRRLREYGKGLDIMFQGAVSDPLRVADFMSAGDVFVYPVVYSGGIATSVLQAMSCQLPIVVGRAGPTKDAIVDRENGFVMRGANADSIVEAVTYLLKHPRVRDGIGQRARETVVDEYDVGQYGRTVIERILS